MIDRSRYDICLDQLHNIIDHYSNEDFNKIYERLLWMRNAFEIKLLVVGHYNAGKSSIINGLIERPKFLEENIIPTTGIAAELSFSENEEYKAYKNDGCIESINTSCLYDSENYKYLKYKLNANGLKSIPEFTIVDTPGVDTGFKNHNRAIKNYIDKGSAYLIVVDQARGGIDDLTLNLINEVSLYSNMIAVVITHTDLIIKEAAEKIKKAAETTLKMFGYNYPVYLVSKFDKDIKEELVSVIKQFNAQALFDKKLNEKIIDESKLLHGFILDIKSNLYLNTYELDEKIRKNQKLINQLEDTLTTKKNESLSSANTMTEEVISELKNALRSKSRIIARSILSGNNEAVKAQIIDVIRPILIAYSKSISIDHLDSIAAGLEEIKNNPSIDENSITCITQNMLKEIKEAIENGSFMKAVEGTKDLLKKQGKYKNIYRAVSSIGALVTDVISPWLEIVIVLLPEIIEIGKILTGNTNLDKVEQQFLNELIPQIGNSLYRYINCTIEENIKFITEEVEKVVDERQNCLKNNINEISLLKNKKENEFNNFRKIVDVDLTTLKTIIDGEK